MRFHTQLDINLLGLERNISRLKNITNKNKIIFMIKANAYGHGIGQISDFSFNELGVEEFGCASLGEAIYLRRAHPNMMGKLIVFSDGNFQDESLHELYLDYNIIPVLHHMDDFKLFLKLDSFKYTPLYLKFDTGMNRLGLNPNDLEDIIKLIKDSGRSSIDHLMTHFSSSYFKYKEGDKTAKQLKSFLDTKQMILDSGLKITESSVANSGAIEQGIGLDETHIRPGLMLYGPPSVGGIGSSKALWDGECVSSFKTQIIKTMKVSKGLPVGYGGHVVGKDGVLVYLPIGYGDGVLTILSGCNVNHGKHRGKILGRVNMDLMCVQFDLEAESDLRRGDDFHLWSHDVKDVCSLANQSKTIPYQLFCAVSSRINRRYYSI